MPLNTDLRLYADWALLRWQNGEDPRDLAAFTAHLKAIGADAADPGRYGWPVPAPMQPALRVALSAGHHNMTGGSAIERAITGPLCHAIADACRKRGLDVRVITPGDGLGDFPHGLDAVAQTVVDWDRAGWTVDVFLEVHTNAAPGQPNVRGVCVIYPDWGADVNADVRDRLGPDLARRVSAATGLPVWSAGVLSEKQTFVGSGGSRLAVFRVAEPIASHATRLIVEYGYHTSPADRAIQQAPAFFAQAAQATVEALTAFAGPAST